MFVIRILSYCTRTLFHPMTVCYYCPPIVCFFSHQLLDRFQFPPAKSARILIKALDLVESGGPTLLPLDEAETARSNLVITLIMLKRHHTPHAQFLGIHVENLVTKIIPLLN